MVIAIKQGWRKLTVSMAGYSLAKFGSVLSLLFIAFILIEKIVFPIAKEK